MRSTATIVLSLLPLFAHGTTVKSGTSQAIVPFASLPLCAQSCGPLFDAQGACGETSALVTSATPSCFCKYGSLSGLSSGGTATTCPTSECDTTDSASIVSWFNTYCASVTGTSTTASNTGTATAAVATSSSTGSSSGTTSDSSSSSNSSSNNSSSNGSWISTHYQYIIMIVVIILGLAGLWIGGYMLRKRHIARRERAFELRPPIMPWGPNTAHITPNMSQVSFHSEGRSASPLPQMYYAGKGRSPLAREFPMDGNPSVTNLESGQNADPFGGKRLSRSKLGKMIGR